MARILAYTSPARGHIYPITPTLLELAARGHHVAVRTLRGEVETLRRLGLTASPISAAVEDRLMDDYQGGNPLASLSRAVRTFADRARHEPADLRAAIAEERPDVLLIDINSTGASAAAEASGLPWAMFSPYLLPLPSRDLPPFGPGLTPRRDLLGMVRDTAIRTVVQHACRSALADINHLRRELGVPPLPDLFDGPRRAPRLLYYTAREFDYPRADWPDTIRFVGPGIWEPPSAPPTWVSDLDRNVVLVTSSTEYQNDDAIIASTLEALADEDVTVVATCPSGQPPSGVQKNARLERFIPHGPVLEKAVCVVCHGGMGITQKALSAGVPVCVIPFGRDQLEVARRVEHCDAGTTLPPSKLAAVPLKAAIRAAREKAPAARRLADAFARAGGPPAAAAVVEELLTAPVLSARTR